MSDSLEARTIEVNRPVDHERFVKTVEAFRGELRLHCYRMLGSLEDAEDLAQETVIRAWQHYRSFEGRGSIRSWLYRIATNACLDALERRSRRLLPAFAGPAADPRQPPGSPLTEPVWLDPLPDELMMGLAPSPEAQFGLRESVSLAFLVAIQFLPPRQRAVLLLSDVLDWHAKEVAELLDITVSAVNSLLHRARTALRRCYRIAGEDDYQVSTPDKATQELLDRFVKAWEEDDVVGLVALLREDATFSMPPWPSWYQGRESIGLFVGEFAFGGQVPTRWRVRQIQANGQRATAAYRFDQEAEAYVPCSIQVLTIVDGQIVDVTNFKNPALFPRFGLPLELEA